MEMEATKSELAVVLAGLGINIACARIDRGLTSST